MIDIQNEMTVRQICIQLRLRFGWTAAQCNPVIIRQILAALAIAHAIEERRDQDAVRGAPSVKKPPKAKRAAKVAYRHNSA